MKVIQELQNILQPMLEKGGVELVDIQHQREKLGWVLRVLLDKPGGVSLNDCETWSRIIEETLEGRALMDHSYTLEVSSPGINRPLKTEEDFRKFAGERAKVDLFAPKNGQRHFRGTIVSAHAGRIILDDVAGKRVTLEISAISKAKLDPEIKI